MIYLKNLVSVRFIIKTLRIITFSKEIRIQTNFVRLKIINRIRLEEIQDMEIHSEILILVRQIQFIDLNK